MTQVTINIWYITILILVIIYLFVRLYTLNKRNKELELFFGQKCKDMDTLSVQYSRLQYKYKDLEQIIKNDYLLSIKEKQTKDKPDEKHYGC